MPRQRCRGLSYCPIRTCVNSTYSEIALLIIDEWNDQMIMIKEEEVGVRRSTWNTKYTRTNPFYCGSEAIHLYPCNLSAAEAGAPEIKVPEPRFSRWISRVSDRIKKTTNAQRRTPRSWPPFEVMRPQSQKENFFGGAATQQ